ncbi:hypothetical protein [Chitinophaga sp. CF418]|uniref:hypothetical protein n=1 Tax=Chitinophaga sp. CF418 TaxID=1855287 RepID=UPI0009217C48|nr:hypothetical protein [Chitinophaga sp. CF418]SHN06980.1 hypothetical protein SAMN05216311_1057 [Chitinophaga sp. CF418]
MEDLLNELAAFRKQLAALENQNIALKIQLAHILQYNFDRSLLDKLEYFHTAFLQLDTRFEGLKSELALHQAWLADPDMNSINYDNIRAHQLHIWGKLNTMEADVHKLKSLFSDYLQEHFPSVAQSIL